MTTIPRQPFTRALARAAGVAPNRSPMPILGNALIRQEDGRITVAATDLDISVSITIDCRGAKAGPSVAINAKALLARVKAMPDGDIVLKFKDGAAHGSVAGSKRRFSLTHLDGDDFPLVPATDAAHWEIPAAAWRGLIDAIKPAVSPDHTRLHLHSGLMKCDGKSITMASTDGHRLHVYTVPAECEPLRETLIPLAGMLELRRALDGLTGDAMVAVADGRLFLSNGDESCSFKLTDAAFPPYEQVIPSPGSTWCSIDSVVLAEAVSAVAVSSANGGMTITLGSSLCLASSNPEGSESDDQLDCDSGGEPVTFGVFAPYMLDALTAAGGGVVHISTNGALDPVLITGREGVTVVLMPMRI